MKVGVYSSCKYVLFDKTSHMFIFSDWRLSITLVDLGILWVCSPPFNMRDPLWGNNENIRARSSKLSWLAVIWSLHCFCRTTSSRSHLMRYCALIQFSLFHMIVWYYLCSFHWKLEEVHDLLKKSYFLPSWFFIFLQFDSWFFFNCNSQYVHKLECVYEIKLYVQKSECVYKSECYRSSFAQCICIWSRQCS